MTSGEYLADELRRALRGEAWHGPALQEILSNIAAEEAMQRPIPNAHNIWEITLHIASWANIALRRINGGQVEPFEGEDWPEVHDFSGENWDAAVSSMTESYERLSEVVLGMTESELMAKAPKSERTIAGMVSGVVQHAAYHGGQIALLRKSVTTYHRRAAL
ncbi:MAG TPA: DinB family protein [Gemmatimonadaceae bacterium]